MAQIQYINHYNEVYAAIHADTIEKLNRAGDLIRDSMKQECPVNTGALKKSIRVKRLPKELAVKIIAGGKKAWYVHLVVFGLLHIAERFTKGRGPHVFKAHSTGSFQPNNFMLRALNKNIEALQALFGRPITTFGSKAA
ncbi:MAG: HK97 gp10 family phage protein [Candidatus Omnitrophica bacterium]|nr:HK97 gp10 family phage protein [Candidatus Omnitrophota bacterium]